MRYATFLEAVERAGGITREEAERATEAVLRTLAERITGGEARDIALHLPRELRHHLTDTPEPAERFGLDEFLRRVAEREGVDVRTASEHARAVFTALGASVAPGELRDMAAQLPRDFDDLLEAAGLGRRSRIEQDDELVTRVVEATGLDRERARRGIDAALETLAVRISAGEVDDLLAELPPELHPPLERGVAISRAARSMTADQFVTRVAARARLDPDRAREVTRAVFAALRDLVDGKEFRDIVAQLSRDYEPLLSAAG